MLKLPDRALSIRQPWATLVVQGLKTVEIRRWDTRFRGPVLIHASGIRDKRPEAWLQLPEQLKKDAEVIGGIIGCVELIGVRAYHDAEAFVKEQGLHLNDPSWYRPPVLYGFAFVGARRLPFRPCAGQVRFFTVREEHR